MSERSTSELRPAPPNPWRPIAPWANALTTELNKSPYLGCLVSGYKVLFAQWVQTMKDWSDDPSHHERTLLPRSYIVDALPLSARWRPGSGWSSEWWSTRYSSMGRPWRIDPTTHRTMSERSYLTRVDALPLSARWRPGSGWSSGWWRARYSSMGRPWRIDPTTHRTMSERSYQGAKETQFVPWLPCIWPQGRRRYQTGRRTWPGVPWLCPSSPTAPRSNPGGAAARWRTAPWRRPADRPWTTRGQTAPGGAAASGGGQGSPDRCSFPAGLWPSGWPHWAPRQSTGLLPVYNRLIMYVCMYVCVCVSMYIYMYVCVCVCMCVYVCVCAYIYIYTHTHTHVYTYVICVIMNIIIIIIIIIYWYFNSSLMGINLWLITH